MAKIGIFTGTIYGNALLVATEAQQILNDAGHQAELFENGTLADWQRYAEQYVLVVTSTTGQGDLPDNILSLFNQLKDQCGYQPALRYGIIALGNSDYDTYCNGGKQFDALLQDQQAQRIGEVLLVDASQTSEPETISNPWVEQWSALVKANG